MGLPKVYLEAINNGLDYAVLTAKNPIFPYENGKKSSDVPTGWKVSILLPGNSFSALTVKFNDAKDPLPSITDETIAEACISLNPILVRLVDCMVSIFVIDGIRMTATASAVELIKANK